MLPRQFNIASQSSSDANHAALRLCSVEFTLALAGSFLLLFRFGSFTLQFCSPQAAGMQDAHPQAFKVMRCEPRAGSSEQYCCCA
jgi:hypothetical protein